MFSALIGVSFQLMLTDFLWLSCALSVAPSIVVMEMTKTLHPPGGATALIANIGSEKIKGPGYFFILSPVLSGALILFSIALLIINLPKHRLYPYRK